MQSHPASMPHKTSPQHSSFAEGNDFMDDEFPSDDDGNLYESGNLDIDMEDVTRNDFRVNQFEAPEISWQEAPVQFPKLEDNNLNVANGRNLSNYQVPNRDRPSTSGYIPPSSRPMNYGTSDHPPSSRPEMCVICRTRPRYSKGSVSYLTCGTTCGDALRAREREPQSQNKFRSMNVGMCQICRVRPQCVKNGRIYPTCGLTCAAKMNPPNASAGLCDFCHQRPKVVIGSKVYPQCGRTCRDKARVGTNNNGTIIGTCTSCLVCWKAHKKAALNFCTKECEDIAAGQAPLLLEAPRGHVLFNQIHELFQKSWKSQKQTKPIIKHIYLLFHKSDIVVRHEKFRSQANSGASSRKVNGSQRWIGAVRECNTGDAGNVDPCMSPTCPLCSIVRNSFTLTNFPNGIPASGTSSKANELFADFRPTSTKAMFLNRVVCGRETEMTLKQLFAPIPHGHEFVRIVSYQYGRKIDSDDLHIYVADAIMPRYLIIYS